MTTKSTLSPRLYFSYGQFMIYDRDVELPGCDWTEEHTAQGFARRQSVVNFNSLLEFGHADLTVSSEPYQPRREYERVIAVPFLVTSGIVIVEGPEETAVERNIKLQPGTYRLVAAQYVTTGDQETIDLYFEPVTPAVRHSVILLADEGLNPPDPLIETAQIAGES